MPISHSEKETKEIAAKLAEGKSGVFCLYGELGAGKTVFSKGFADALGISEFSIKSPTYTYIRKYPIKGKTFYHIDLYRLERIDNLLAFELEEIMENPENIILIEWADRMDKHLPNMRTDIYLKYENDHSRKITIQKVSGT